jgi:hypothetical protein
MQLLDVLLQKYNREDSSLMKCEQINHQQKAWQHTWTTIYVVYISTFSTPKLSVDHWPNHKTLGNVFLFYFISGDTSPKISAARELLIASVL